MLHEIILSDFMTSPDEEKVCKSTSPEAVSAILTETLHKFDFLAFKATKSNMTKSSNNTYSP